MLDPKLLRDNIDDVALRLKSRGFILDVAKFNALETQRKQLQMATEQLQNERNSKSKAIGQAKAQGQNVDSIMADVKNLGDKLQQAKQSLENVLQELHEFQARIPNLPQTSVPKGTSELDNREIHRKGEPRQFAFTPLDHQQLGENLTDNKHHKLMNFEAATKISGARFVVLQGKLASLQRALVQFMLDIHLREHGYTEVYVPYIVNADSLFGTSQLPKFAEDQFKLVGDQNYYLIPTAEVPVTNMVRDEIIAEENLPLKYVCHTPCFRSEAGSYGKDTRGMIRQHQFEKVELVQLVKPEESEQAHEELTRHAETILERLELPYRRVALCTADMGFGAAKTYDLEVWLPSQNMYREISSCSNYEAFQARRMQARFRNSKATGKPELLHSLNGSALAVGRTLVAIMENYQDAEGNIHIPHALQAYCDGMTVVGK